MEHYFERGKVRYKIDFDNGDYAMLDIDEAVFEIITATWKEWFFDFDNNQVVQYIAEKTFNHRMKLSEMIGFHSLPDSFVQVVVPPKMVSVAKCTRVPKNGHTDTSNERSDAIAVAINRMIDRYDPENDINPQYPNIRWETKQVLAILKMMNDRAKE